MGLNLRGSTSGAIDINPPAVAGDNAITLPASNGSANQFFKNSGTAGIVTYSSMVENSGKIGIGTAQPVNKFQVGIDTTSFNILSNGLVGIGTTDPNSLGRFTVVVPSTGGHGAINIQNHEKGSGKTNIVMRSLDNNGGNWAIAEHRAEGFSFKIATNERLNIASNGQISFRNAGSEYGFIKESGSGNTELGGTTDLKLSTDGTERLRITSAGKVGLGETSPLGQFHIKTGDSGASSVGASADEFVIEGSANSGMTILSGTTGQGLINFADSGDVNVGNITYDHNSNFMSFKTTDAERLRILSGGGITFNGDTATANALDDYEEGTITTWRLVKSDANTNGSNNADTEVQYTKIGRCVYISGHIRTDSTETGKTGNLKLVSTADGSTAATLPFVPNHRGGLPIVHTRSCSTSDTTYGLSVGFNQGSSTVYVYANDSTGDYILDSNTLDTNTQTNLVITFNGHYFTNS